MNTDILMFTAFFNFLFAKPAERDWTFSRPAIISPKGDWDSVCRGQSVASGDPVQELMPVEKAWDRVFLNGELRTDAHQPLVSVGVAWDLAFGGRAP